MLLHARTLTAWVAANIIASAAFLHFASWTWLEPNLRGEGVARGGDAVVFMLSAFPILFASALINLLWLLLITRERGRIEAAWPISPVILIAVTWTCALTVNYLRSAGF
jgi:hypothetical protein